jgi:hypothetical protein
MELERLVSADTDRVVEAVFAGFDVHRALSGPDAMVRSRARRP